MRRNVDRVITSNRWSAPPKQKGACEYGFPPGERLMLARGGVESHNWSLVLAILKLNLLSYVNERYSSSTHNLVRFPCLDWRE